MRLWYQILLVTVLPSNEEAGRRFGRECRLRHFWAKISSTRPEAARSPHQRLPHLDAAPQGQVVADRQSFYPTEERRTPPRQQTGPEHQWNADALPPHPARVGGAGHLGRSERATPAEPVLQSVCKTHRPGRATLSREESWVGLGQHGPSTGLDNHRFLAAAFSMGRLSHGQNRRFFLTPAKNNPRPTRVGPKLKISGSSVISDPAGRPTLPKAREAFPCIVQRIHFADADTGKEIVWPANHLKVPPCTITALDRNRRLRLFKTNTLHKLLTATYGTKVSSVTTCCGRS